MAKFKGVLAGLGNYGRNWARVCSEHPDVELMGFAARSEISRERARGEWGVPQDRLFDSVEEAIEKTRPDFVLDVTTPASHREVAIASFSAGIPVLGEKPMSDEYSVAQEMVTAGEKAGCIHMISQNRRFDPQPRITRRLIEEGRIGDPGQLDIFFFVPWADNPGSHYVTEPYMFLLDMGCHHFDAIRYVLADTPVRANVVSWNLPWGWHEGDASHVAVFDFNSGMKAIHRATGCSVGRRTTWSGDWRIEGPGGSITWEDGKVFYAKEHRIETSVREEIEFGEFEGRSSSVASLEEFLSALREDREPETSGRDNLGTMAMTFAAVKSAEEGRSVSLDELE